MIQFRYVHAWLYSFFSKALYIDVANRWRGSGFIYLFVLIALFLIPQTIITNNQLHRFITENEAALKNLPTITIKNGVVSTPEKKSYLLSANPKSALNFVVIDTTGQYKNLPQANAMFLLTRDRIIFKDVHGDTQFIAFQKSMNYVVTKENAVSTLTVIKNWGGFLLYIPLLLVNVVHNFLFLIVYTLLSYFVFSKLLHANFTYQQVSRLAAVAMSPAIIVCNVVCTMYSPQSIFYTLLTIAYVIFGLYAARGPLKELK